MLPLIGSILSCVIGMLSSLSMLVLLMGGLANAKETQIRQGKMMMLGIAVVEAISLAIAVWLMVQRKHGYASIAGAMPLAVVITMIVILVKIEW